MKVFYKPLSITQLQSLLNPQSGTPVSLVREELPLPSRVYESLKKCLESSSAILPPSGRNFTDWKVGLLDVYEKKCG
jgi:hypothetical protein